MKTCTMPSCQTTRGCVCDDGLAKYPMAYFLDGVDVRTFTRERLMEELVKAWQKVEALERSNHERRVMMFSAFAHH